MTERGRRLLERDSNEIDLALAHPAQRNAVRLIEDLLVQLRATRTDRDRFEFQRELFAATVQAQTKQAEASRNVQRARRGRSTASAVTGDWLIEQAVWDRIVRQLRTVGDALAWRVFGFDRRCIIALSKNAPVSPLIDKAGLEYEIREVEERWRQLGQFSLLHDLTSVIRIGDVTAFTTEGPRLVDDIKANPGNRRSAQTQRAKRALAVINERAPLRSNPDETLDLVVTDQQFKTHLEAARRALEAADREGLAWTRIAEELVAGTFSTMAPDRPKDRPPPTDAELIEAAARREVVVYEKAGLDQSSHHLRGVRIDTHTLDPGLAPYTIYPFTPDMCARLTTDHLVIETVLGWGRLGRAFSTLGYETECPLEDRDGRGDAHTPVALLRKGDLTVTLHAWALQQLQFELLDIDRFAAGVDDVVGRQVAQLLEGMGGARRGAGVLTFANERAVWR